MYDPEQHCNIKCVRTLSHLEWAQSIHPAERREPPVHTIPTLSNEHGFTFIELLVVVALVSLLLAIAVPVYQSVVVTAEET